MRAFFRGLFGFVTGTLAEKLSIFLLIFGIGGVAIGLYALITGGYAGFTYNAAQATIVEAGWRCGPYIGIDEHACTEAEAEAFRNRGVPTDFKVTYRFTDAAGRPREVTTDIIGTGMRRAAAKPGVTFDILYDPEDPTHIELPVWSNTNAMTAGLIGLAAMALYGLLFWRRRRARAAG